MRQEALRVSQIVEKHFIYEEVPGTPEFSFQARDTMNSNREIYLSDQGSIDLIEFTIMTFYFIVRNHTSIQCFAKLKTLYFALSKKL